MPGLSDSIILSANVDNIHWKTAKIKVVILSLPKIQMHRLNKKRRIQLIKYTFNRIRMKRNIRQICFIYFLGLLGSCLPIFAQQDTLSATRKDSLHLTSLSSWQKFQKRTDKVIANKAFQMTYIGVPLIIGGLVVKNEDDHFHDLRNSYIPTFRQHYDDYLQYIPAVAMLGMKIGGIEGRSSWPRMLVSDAFSVGLMAVTINTLKNTIHVRRPDGSTRNSFPSGHTATAFMTATMLHKEYGLTQSPWYSVGAYSIATATAVSRMLNNKHWLSDVMVGAGVGILSTELGYFLADLIFKEKGIRHSNIDFNSFNLKRNPSFFGIYMGFSLMPTQFVLTPKVKMKASPGSTAGFEGAWFMNRYLGFGGRISATSMPLSLTQPLSNSVTADIAGRVKGLQSDPLDMVSGYVGSYLSFPLTDHYLLGTKLLVGGIFIPGNSVSALYTEENSYEIKKHEICRVNNSFNIGYSTSASITYILKPNMGIRVFIDYNVSPARFVTHARTENGSDERFEEHKTLQSFALGASVHVMLW